MSDKKKEKKEKKHRLPKPIRVALKTFLCAVAVIVVATIVAWCVGSNHAIRYMEKYEPIGDNGLEYGIDEDTGYYRFIKRNDSDFKLLRLSDTHFGGGLLSMKYDEKAMDTIYTLAAENKPDLIIVTGDMVFPVPYISGTNNNYHEFKIFIEFMEKLEIPWTVTFGNHDTEVYSFADREKLSNYIQEYETEYCIYQPGPEDIYGYGNTMIEVENSDGTINMVYVVLDSNSYVDGSVHYEYDSIHADQVEWYKTQIKELADIYTDGDTSKLPSIALWHIACKEFQYAYDAYLSGSDDVEWLGIGEVLELEEYVSEPEYPETDTIFDAIKALESTKVIVVGHDHYNSFGAKYQDVYLCYGLPIDYLGYYAWDPDFAEKTDFRGVTLLTTDGESNVKLDQDRFVGDDTSARFTDLWD